MRLCGKRRNTAASLKNWNRRDEPAQVLAREPIEFCGYFWYNVFIISCKRPHIFRHEIRGFRFSSLVNFDCKEVMQWNGLKN